MSLDGDTVRSWVVCLIPRRVCVWLWAQEEWFPVLGAWGPHILGRMLGVDAQRVKGRAS
jgi:hypothetical protein